AGQPDSGPGGTDCRPDQDPAGKDRPGRGDGTGTCCRTSLRRQRRAFAGASGLCGRFSPRDYFKDCRKPRGPGDIKETIAHAAVVLRAALSWERIVENG